MKFLEDVVKSAEELLGKLYFVSKKIEKRGDEWVVLDSSGEKVLGRHDSQESAKRQLRAIEANKADDAWERSTQIYKVNEEKQLVTGVVMEPGEIDTQGDFTTASEIETAAHLFMTKSRIVGKGHATKAKAEVVESYVSGAEMEIGGQKVKKGSWIMTVKVHDPDLWTAVKSGEFSGFSIGGRAKKLFDQEVSD